MPFSLLDVLTVCPNFVLAYLVFYPYGTWKGTAGVKTSKLFIPTTINPWNACYSLAILLQNSMDVPALQTAVRTALYLVWGGEEFCEMFISFCVLPLQI